MTGPVTTEALVASLREANERFAKAEIALQQVTAERDEARAKQAHADELRLRWQQQVQKWASERDEALQRSLDNFDRASKAEASLATATSELARLRAEGEAKDRRIAALEAALTTVKTWIDTDLPAGTSRAGTVHRAITKALDATALARAATAREG